MAAFHFSLHEQSVRETLARVTAFLDLSGVPASLAQTAQIVLAEVLNNIEEHAYADRPGGTVQLDIVPSAAGLRCVVTDQGRALKTSPMPGERLPEVDEDDMNAWPEGGFGWSIVRQLVRDLDYTRCGPENRLTFVIAAHGPENS